ncbi:hypothetical protein [Metabacillus fastidiosus]|uniref:Uncharacterized protein n=1 Tax=Metabacillus fastidiosus TaxID=1458 RepID=A0ABU6NVB8_9BACI|nr:hypothetical protein [Metabacillus fastidiosus]MEC2078095.1 hypothetical protein [Metabacillus fastidiosus]MED4400179.1 hypothetical protein [Metabacillus fastidiosus]MED4462685.1 hypothetical protein [Metabacillus fastidiosus]MED4531993.1 hypothetical protein [Metabacillus fastidiosus]
MRKELEQVVEYANNTNPSTNSRGGVPNASKKKKEKKSTKHF